MMFNNSGNMGIPLLVLAFGDAALPAAIVLLVLPKPLLCKAARYSSYERNVKLMYGSTRVTAAVLPFQKARKPSSRQI